MKNTYSDKILKRTKTVMALLLAVTYVVILALTSCGMISKEAETSIDDKVRQDTSCHQAHTYSSISEISFFGKPVLLDDSTHIMQQITEIVANDTKLSIDGWVLTVCQVGFRVNMGNNVFSLISSTQTDDPTMKEVVEYLNSIYGVPEEDEPDYYWWHVSSDDDNPSGWIVRMRPLHTVEGGTVLFF